jgi:glycosyltransferase involved in cell wall biosynthesis
MANASKIHTQRWAKYFAERGHEVHIISFEQPDVELSGINIHIVKTNKKYLYISFPYKSFQFRRIINDIKPDIVHAHYVTKYGVIGALTGLHPFVVSAWGSDVLINPKESIILKKAVKFALKKADLITCDAEHMIEELVSIGTNPKKITLSYFGTDIQKFNPEQKSEKLGEKLGVLNSPTIISIRNLTPIYNVESLIKAIPIVLKEVPEAKFVIAGRGSQEEKLEQLAKSLGVSDSIRFVGFIAQEELPEYLASADIYVSTSLSDAGLAASTAEAMACGLPVVITDFGDNSKWVEDGVNGFIVPLKAPKALAEKIIYLLENEDIRREFGMRNKKIIEERNNYYKVMEKMENIYIELIERYKS